jgi:signal transduction histidine kinase
VLKVESTSPAGRFHRSQSNALRHLLRIVRHEMATPLSASLLHLEVATRRLKKLEGCDPSEVLESLRVAQQELLRASGLLDHLSAAAAPEEEPGEFSLAEAVRLGASALAEEVLARGIRLELPGAGTDLLLCGFSEQVERAASELTRHVLSRSSGEGSIVWSIVSGADGHAAVCRAPAKPSPEDPERLMAREFGLLQARCAVEGHGGRLKLSQEGTELRAELRFPAAA